MQQPTATGATEEVQTTAPETPEHVPSGLYDLPHGPIYKVKRPSGEEELVSYRYDETGLVKRHSWHSMPDLHRPQPEEYLTKWRNITILD